MHEYTDNELAVLALLAVKPRRLFPPRIWLIAERLSDVGLAVYVDGEWLITAEGRQIQDQSRILAPA